MPDKTVAQHLHAGSLGLVDKLVGQREVVDTLLRMNHLALHAVFGNHPVEVLRNDIPVGSLVVGYHAGNVVYV